MKARLLSLAAAVAALGTLGACGDPLRVNAAFVTVQDTLSAFAFTGTPVHAPSALNTLLHEVVRPDPATVFDVVFDIRDGQGMIYPPRVVGLVGSAGLLRSTVEYDSLRSAPVDGYQDTTATLVAQGDVVVIRAQSTACINALSPYIYSKLAIDSVNLATRMIHFRIHVDPNCGFRDFTEGIPQN